MNYTSTSVRALRGTEDLGQSEMTPKDVLTLCLESMNYRVEFSKDASAALEKKVPHGIQYLLGTKSTWDMVLDIAQNASCTFWFGMRRDGKQWHPTAHVFTYGEAAVAPPQRTYVMRGNFDPTRNQYPLLEFGPMGSENYRWDAAFLDDRATGVSAAWLDDRAGGEIKGLEFKSVERGGGTDKGKSNPDPTPGDVQENKSGVKPDASLESSKTKLENAPMAVEGGESQDRIKQRLGGQVQESSAGFMASLLVLGSPLQLPGENVLVYGCSKRYDGVYQVKGVTHSYARGQFDTTLTAFESGVYQPSGTDEQAGSEIKGSTVPGTSPAARNLGFGPEQM